MPAGDRGVGDHLDAEFPDRRVGQEKAAEQRVVLGLDRAPHPRPLDPLRAAAAGSVQGQPLAAGLQPGLQGAGLRGVGVGAGDIGDQQLADRQPFLEIGEVVGDRGRNLPLGQQLQQPQPGVILVVPAHRPGRKPAGNKMRAAGIRRCHGMPPLTVRAYRDRLRHQRNYRYRAIADLQPTRRYRLGGCNGIDTPSSVCAKAGRIVCGLFRDEDP